MRKITIPAASHRAETTLAVFLVGMVVIWTFLMAISHRAPDLDGMEELVWAVSLEWGYSKHPPLPSWMLHALGQVLDRPIWLPFFAGMCSSAAALWFLWLLGKEFTTPGKAAVGVLLTSVTMYFSIRGTIYNHDTAQLWSVAASIWLFYRALRYQRTTAWVALGAVSALSMLTKYSAVIQFTAFFLFMLRHGSFRDTRTLSGLAWGSLTFGIVLLPHLIWLVDQDFAPFRYAGNSLDAGGRLAALGDAVSFAGTQLARLSPMLVAVLAWAIWNRRQPIALAANDDDRVWARQLSPWDRSFVLWVGLIPSTATLLVACILGTRLVAAWGTTFFMLWSFYFFWVIKGDERETLRRITWIVVSLHLAMALGYALERGPIATLTGRPARSTFPGAEIAAQMQNVWSRHMADKPLRVVASDTWLGGNIALNAGPEVDVFINGRPEESPWLDSDQARNCGLLVVYSRVTRRGAEPAPELLELASLAKWSGTAEQRWSSPRSPLIDLNWAIVPPTELCKSQE